MLFFIMCLFILYYHCYVVFIQHHVSCVFLLPCSSPFISIFFFIKKFFDSIFFLLIIIFYKYQFMSLKCNQLEIQGLDITYHTGNSYNIGSVKWWSIELFLGVHVNIMSHIHLSLQFGKIIEGISNYIKRLLFWEKYGYSYYHFNLRIYTSRLESYSPSVADTLKYKFAC